MLTKFSERSLAKVILKIEPLQAGSLSVNCLDMSGDLWDGSMMFKWINPVYIISMSGPMVHPSTSVSILWSSRGTM